MKHAPLSGSPTHIHIPPTAAPPLTHHMLLSTVVAITRSGGVVHVHASSVAAAALQRGQHAAAFGGSGNALSTAAPPSVGDAAAPAAGAHSVHSVEHESPAAAAARAASFAELAASVYEASGEMLGPLSLADLVFGLQAVAKQHRQQGLSYSIHGGTPLAPPSRELLAQLLDAADLSFAAYKINPQSACAVSHLRLHNLRKFVPHNSRLRPAYFIAVDHSHQRIIWAIRGTKNVGDVLTDAASSSVPLDGGRVHWGVLQAAQALLREEMSHLAGLSRVLPGYNVQLCGHSLGAGVAAVCCHLINSRPALRKQLRACPAVTATVIAPPPVFSEGLAAASERHTTSLIMCHDPVPRLTPAAVQKLRTELLQVDWAAQLKSSLLEAEYSQAITAAISSAGSSTAQAAAQLQQLATELLRSRHIQQLSSALSSVVYGERGQQHGQAGSGQAGSTEALAALASDIYQQQQQEEEEQQRVRWQRQVDAWQQQQRQQQHDGPPSQQQLQAWQADVLRTWVDDVSSKLLPFVQGVKLPDADISRVAEAAVLSLSNSLRSVAFGSSGGSRSGGSSGGGSATTTDSTTSRGVSTPAWLELPALQVLTTMRNAGQLLISMGGSSSSGSSGGGWPQAAGGELSGMLARLPLTPEAMLQYWRTRSDEQQQPVKQQLEKQQREKQQERCVAAAAARTHPSSSSSSSTSLPGPIDVLLGSHDSPASSLGDQAEAAVAATAAAAADAVAAMPAAAAEAVSAVRAAAGMAARAPSSPETVATAAVASAAALAAGAAAAAQPVINMFPPGRLLFVMRREHVLPDSRARQQPEQQEAGDTTTTSSISSSQGADAGWRFEGAPADTAGSDAAAGRFSKARAAAAALLSRQPSSSSSSKARPVQGFGDLRHADYQQHAQQEARSLDDDHISGGAARAAIGSRLGRQQQQQHHVLLEAGRSGNFERLILHPDMFRDHRTRAYRAALLDMLRHAG